MAREERIDSMAVSNSLRRVRAVPLSVSRIDDAQVLEYDAKARFNFVLYYNICYYPYSTPASVSIAIDE